MDTNKSSLAAICILGLMLGWSSGFLLDRHSGKRTLPSLDDSSLQQRLPSSDDSVQTTQRPQVKSNPDDLAVDYESLPCPTEAEFQTWAKELKLIIPEGPSLDESCENNFRSQLGKIFKLMKALEFDLPARWPLPIRNAIQDSYGFLRDHTSKLTLDLNQQGSIAYNIVSKKEIYLGGSFFRSHTPLEGVGILLHEGRHSSEQDPGHVHCDAGNIPKTQGGCDEKFSLGTDAGAYSYNTIFELAVAFYGKRITAADRELSLTKSLVNLGARFNQVPPFLARKVDILAVMSEQNEIFLVHPFLFLTHPLQIKFPESDERPERIEFFTGNNGILIFSNKKRLWTWSPLTGLKEFSAKAVDRSLAVHDMSRMPVPNADNPRPLLRFDNQELKFLNWDIPTSEERLFEYRYVGRERPEGKPKIRRMFMGSTNEAMFIDESGILFLAPHYGNEDQFVKKGELNNHGPWVFGNGGVTYDDLYLLNSEGKLHFATWAFDENSEGMDKIFKVEPSDFAPNAKKLKYAQGLQVEMVLDENGELHVRKYSDKSSRVIKFPSKVKDFVLGQNAEFGSFITNSTLPSRSFRKSCEVVQEIPDPWLGTGIGYDASGQLVMGFSDPAKPCHVHSRKKLSDLTPYFDSPVTSR